MFNPFELVPEFTADVGSKKNEKVDYAIMRDGTPSILIECTSIQAHAVREAKRGNIKD